MSEEITEVPPPVGNNGSIELQPITSATRTVESLLPPVEHPTTVPPIPSSPTTGENQKNKRGGSKRRNRQKKGAKNWFEEMRGWIMIVGVQVAAVTYASGLNPPGGFWPDDKDDHIAGHAILHDKSKSRYTTFYYANATAFMASLVVIVLLMNEKFYLRRSRVVVLNVFVVLGLVSLMLAYAAGSARRITTSVYVIVLAVGVLLVVIFSAHILKYVGSWIAKSCPCIGKLLCPSWIRMCMGEREEKEEEEEEEKDEEDRTQVV
ncbi:hypothetical protein LUZ62_029211 [Rhynchospora pubera]|uniref:PGG domain-containing protein n=1 Tax=Rhynchospora pubera TaxID=906938 RepID=A0AAV8HLD0_9POAL|nr:hypothetical protein LUZ62_029211 [Rhynchospora pubera]